MTVILNIFRWLFGLVFAFLFFIFAVTGIPLSLIFQQVTKTEVGMSWARAIAEDPATVSILFDSFLEGIAESGAIDDPALQQTFRQAASPTTELGKALRILATPEIIGRNIIENTEKYYVWRDGDSLDLDIRLKLAEDDASWAQLVAVMLQSRYESLEACTPQQRASLGRVDAKTIAEIPCSVGSMSPATFRAAAREMVAKPEEQKIIREGFPLLTYDATNRAEAQEAKDSILRSERGLTTLRTVMWIGLLLLLLLMLVLFTPTNGVNFIVTGVIAIGTGIAISGIGRMLLTIHEVVRETLSQPLVNQGMVLVLLGVVSIGFGIWKLAKKGKEAKVV